MLNHEISGYKDNFMIKNKLKTYKIKHGKMSMPLVFLPLQNLICMIDRRFCIRYNLCRTTKS